MNKKFSTLLVSALLAGGLFSTVQAIDLRTAKPGQYYKLVRTAEYASSAWSQPGDAYIVADANGNAIVGTVTDESGYWTIETRSNTTGTDVRLVNVKTGKAIKLSDGTNSSEWFAVNYHAKGTTMGAISALTADANELQWGGAGLPNYFGFKNDGGWVVTNATTSSAGSYPEAINAVPVDPTEYTVKQLNDKLNSGFGLQIGYLKDGKFKEYSLQGAEAFAGKLIAKSDLEGAETAATQEICIFNSSAKAYVVLTKQKWTSNGTTDLFPNNSGKGYKFALMTKKEIVADDALSPSEKQVIASSFHITAPASTDESPIEVAAHLQTGKDLELYVAEVNGNYYLTTNWAHKGATAMEEGAFDKVAAYSPSTHVRFGLSNLMDASEFYGSAVTITNSYGKTISPVDDQTWVDADYVALTQPEGQWIVTTKNGVTTWKNRETGEDATAIFSILRKKADGVYYTGAGKDYVEYYLTKTDKLGGNNFAYYDVLDSSNPNAGEPRSYKISFYNKTSDEYNYVGFNGKGELILTNNVANAVIFDVEKVKLTNDLSNEGKVSENTLTDVISYKNNIMVLNKDNEWEYKAVGDTVSFYRYYLKSDYGYLTMGDGALTLSSRANADFFVIKKKDNGQVNILNVGTKDYDLTRVTPAGSAIEAKATPKYAPENWEIGRELLTAGWQNDPTIDENRRAYEVAKMLYFDNNHALLKQQANIYQWEANAQLVIDDKATVTYRSLEAHKTYEFFRTEFSDEFLFERGEFLGMTTKRFDYNPAIFVDTAYVRNETVKPLYMLAVGVDQTPESTYCPIHGTEPCDHALDVPGNIAARYLVSYTDSVAKYAELVQNPFCYTNTEFTKLGFVPAIHTVDSVFVGEDEEPTFVFGAQKVTPITFAFRIVNPETEDFVIETGRLSNEDYALAGWNPYQTAWIKWHNGCPVLTNDIAEAEVFNVRASEAEATANEAVAAEVSVVAAQGAIIVKGAAGKVVTVANILGQTIANQVAASDNVTIAAPAGIAVVTVDGEATKVVVK